MDNWFGTRSKRVIAFVAVLLVLVGAMGTLARPAWAAATYTVKLLYTGPGSQTSEEVDRKEGVTEFPCEWSAEDAEALVKSILEDQAANVTSADSFNVADAQTTQVDVNYYVQGDATAQTLQLGVTVKNDQFITAADVTGKVAETGKKIEPTAKDGDGNPITGATFSFAIVGEDGSTVDTEGKPAQSDVIEVNKSTGALTFKKAGTAKVRVTAAESDEYAEATKDVTVTVKAVVSFDKNAADATGTMDPIEVDGTATQLPANMFERDNYEFTGWQDSVDATKTYADKGTITTDTNVTLLAQWAEVPYAVKVVAGQGGVASADYEAATVGTTVNLTATPDEGYTFKEWSTTTPDVTITNPTAQEASFTMPGSDVTVEAEFEAIPSVTLSFAANGGAGTMSSITASQGETVNLPANTFTREGYKFSNWNTRANGSGTTYKNNGSMVLSEDSTLYAQWTEVKQLTVTITFDKNAKDATGEMDSISGTTDTWNADKQRWQWKTTLPKNEFVRVGYDFAGWNTKADGSGTSLKNKAGIAVRGDTTLYAQWTKADPVTVTFDKNASDAEGEMESLSVEKHAKVKLPECEFTRENYVFLNWYVINDKGEETDIKDQATVTVNKDATLYARWGKITVSFDKNASDAKGKMASIEATMKGDSIKLPANAFTREGYAFVGWNTKADGSGTEVHDRATIKVNASVTLYAQWDNSPDAMVTITFDKNASDASGTMDKLDVLKGTTAQLPANKFTRSGYTFAGWSLTADGSGSIFGDEARVKINKDATLYAQWQKGDTPIKPGYVRLTFDKNADDAQGEMDYVEVEKGSTVTLPANAFTRDGYYFKNWNLAADGSGTSLKNGASVKINANATLYAQWGKGENPDPDDSGSTTGDKEPVVSTSVGGQLMSRTTEVTFMISQQIPADATAIRIWFELDNVMQYTTAADQVTVRVKDGEGLSPMADIQGQTLSWYKSDSDVASLRDKTVQILFKAKIVDGANLDDYTYDDNIAEIPYWATTEFNDAGESRTVSSEEKVLKVSLGKTSGGSNGSSNTVARTTTRTSNPTTTGSSSKSKKTPDTGDATSVVGALTTGVAGLALAFGGMRRRKY